MYDTIETMQDAQHVYDNLLTQEGRKEVAEEYNRSMAPYLDDDSDDPGSATEDMFWMHAVDKVYNADKFGPQDINI